MKKAIDLIIAERNRQISEEGYTYEHDQSHNNESLAMAASCYAAPNNSRDSFLHLWPWDMRYYKPTPENRIKELIKSAALIVAEIERLQNITHEKL